MDFGGVDAGGLGSIGNPLPDHGVSTSVTSSLSSMYPARQVSLIQTANFYESWSFLGFWQGVDYSQEEDKKMLPCFVPGSRGARA